MLKANANFNVLNTITIIKVLKESIVSGGTVSHKMIDPYVSRHKNFLEKDNWQLRYILFSPRKLTVIHFLPKL